MFGRVLKSKQQKVIALVVVFLLIVVGIYLLTSSKSSIKITNFEECITAGYPIQESYPRQCRAPDGQVFIEEIQYPVNPEI